MSFAGKKIDWRGLWADWLKGAGRGLLELDGSRAARAALAGLDTFEAAQRKRRRGDRVEESGEREAQHIQAMIASIAPGLELSAAEWAHLLRSSPQEREAWLREIAEVTARGSDAEAVGGNPEADHQGPTWRAIPHAALPRPLSPNPYDGWAIASVLPIAPDGQLTIPSFRR